MTKPRRNAIAIQEDYAKEIAEEIGKKNNREYIEFHRQLKKIENIISSIQLDISNGKVKKSDAYLLTSELRQYTEQILEMSKFDEFDEDYRDRMKNIMMELALLVISIDDIPDDIPDDGYGSYDDLPASSKRKKSIRRSKSKRIIRKSISRSKSKRIIRKSIRRSKRKSSKFAKSRRR